MEGIYSITFRGATGWGLGMLLLRGGRLTGADIGGIRYDGSYSVQSNELNIDAVLTVPPGATLVQGVPPRPQAYEVPFKARVPQASVEEGKAVLVNMPPGPVNVIVKFLRSLED
jgi:hypothetical protein